MSGATEHRVLAPLIRSGELRVPPILAGLLSSHKGMKPEDVVGEAEGCILDRIIASIPLQWRGARQGGVVSGQ